MRFRTTWNFSCAVSSPGFLSERSGQSVKTIHSRPRHRHWYRGGSGGVLPGYFWWRGFRGLV